MLKNALRAYNTHKDSVPIYLDLAYQLALEEHNDTSAYQALIEKINFYGVTGNAVLGDSVFRLASAVVKGDRYSARLLMAYGYLNKELGHLRSALHYYLRAQNLGAKLQDYFVLCGSSLYIARIYGQQNRHQLSTEYTLQALEYARKGKLDYNLEVIYNQLAGQYRALGKFAEAEKYYAMVKEIVTKANDIWGQIILNDNLSELYSQQKRYAQAEQLLLTNMTLSKQADDKEMFFSTLYRLASLHFEQGHRQKARSYIDKALGGLQHLSANVDQRDLYMMAWQVYKASGEPVKALHYHELFKSFSDSLLQSQSDQQLYELEERFHTQEKQQRIEVLAAQNLNKQEQLNKKNVFLVLSVGIILFVTLGLIQLLRLQKKLRIAKNKLEQTNEVIESHRKEILDSIHYANRIQRSLLSDEAALNERFGEHFIFFRPKDIVSGDFYWSAAVASGSAQHEENAPGPAGVQTAKQQRFYLAVCDSTGHGVPGAFMSLLNIGYLSEAVNEKNIEDPNRVFDYVRNRLEQSISKDGQKDGFDGVLMCFGEAEQPGRVRMRYAAANCRPVLIRNGNFERLPGDKMPVGIGEAKERFTLFDVELQKNDQIYICSDGFADQFGGPKGKKFKLRALYDLILENSGLPMAVQCQKLEETFERWKGGLEQVDDVCVIGIRL